MRKLIAHPFAALIIGGLIGVLTTLTGTTISENYDLRQYWREQRIERYPDYLEASRKMYRAINMAAGGDTYQDIPEGTPVNPSLEQLRSIQPLVDNLNEKKKRFD
jgi:hypothetical protein